MAGSIQHTLDKQGNFTMSKIENLGDAYEALEEYYLERKHLLDMLKRCRQIFWNIREGSCETNIIDIADKSERYCAGAIEQLEKSE